VVEGTGGLVGWDVGLVEGEPGGFEVDADEALFEGAVAFADAFDFGTLQDNADLHRVFYEVVMTGPAVVEGGRVGFGFLFVLGHCWRNHRVLGVSIPLLWMRMSMPAGVILVLLCWSLAGCSHPENARLELGTISRTPTFDVDAQAEWVVLDVKSVSRSRWETTVLIAPIDGIAHGGTLRLIPGPGRTQKPRMYGLYPTAASAVDFQRGSYSVGVIRNIFELGASLRWLIDPYLIQFELTNSHWSPRRVWKRSRQDDSWSSGRPQVQAQEASDE